MTKIFFYLLMTRQRFIICILFYRKMSCSQGLIFTIYNMQIFVSINIRYKAYHYMLIFVVNTTIIFLARQTYFIYLNVSIFEKYMFKRIPEFQTGNDRCFRFDFLKPELHIKKGNLFSSTSLTRKLPQYFRKAFPGCSPSRCTCATQRCLLHQFLIHVK